MRFKTIVVSAFLLAGSAQAALIDLGDGTVKDTSSNLIWLRDWTQSGLRTWQDQATWAGDLTYAGSSDWGLASITEYQGLLNSVGGTLAGLQQNFINVQGPYWSSTLEPGLSSAYLLDTLASPPTTNSSHAISSGLAWGVAVRSAPVNSAPVANPGAAQAARVGGTVQLNGSASYDDNTPSSQLLYLWAIVASPSGSTAVLTGAQTATPTFVPDLAGTYRLSLTVRDQEGLQSAAAFVTVSSGNQAPTAYAGLDRLVATFSTVQLVGTGRDPDNDPLTYSWNFISTPIESEPPILFGSASATAEFQPLAPGPYTLILRVTDPYGQSGHAVVTITAATGPYFILDASTLSSQLSSTQVTTAGNQNAFGNLLSNAVKAVDKGDKLAAIEKLKAAILRTDGCERNGVPDGAGEGRDWITDCAVQAQLLAFLRASLSALQ